MVAIDARENIRLRQMFTMPCFTEYKILLNTIVIITLLAVGYDNTFLYCDYTLFHNLDNL